MQATRVTVGNKTYDLNYLSKTKKTNLRRKLIVEHIQSKPAGELISMTAFKDVGQFSTYANTWSFVKRMIRDGVIAQYAGDRPKSYYYAVMGAVRIRNDGHVQPRPPSKLYDAITPLVREYFWESNGGDLHGFMDWLKKLDAKQSEAHNDN